MDSYLDHGAYATNIGATPTWGTPQEGDGAASAAASAASIGSILMTAVPTSGTISVCGVSVSTTSVIGAASADAAANALATNINATSTAVASGVAVGTPQLRNLVFARGPGGGAPAGTCQIMMRVGSATLNYANNTSAAIATTFTGSPTLTQFAGGAGGCWGWFLNTAAIGVSNSITALTYGLFVASPMVRYSGFTFTEHDILNVRTGRNTTLVTGTANISPQANKPAYINMLMDDGTIWTGDGSSSKLTLDWTANGAGYVTLSVAGMYHSIKAKVRGAFTVKFYINSGGSSLPLTWGYDGGSTAWGASYEKVEFIEKTGSYATSCFAFWAPGSSSRYSLSCVDCLFDFTAVPRTNIVASLFDAKIYTTTLIGNDVRWNLTGVGGGAFTVPVVKTSTTGTALQLTARGNTFSAGQPGDLTLYAPGVTLGAGSTLLFENNKGAGLPAGAVGLVNTTVGQNPAYLVFDNLGIGGSAKFESRSGYVEWNAGQPVLSSVAPDGTPWAWLAYWTNASAVISPSQPWALPATRMQSRLTTGARSWSVELLLDSLSLTNLPLFGTVELQYIDETGAPVSERVPVSLATSSASWTNAGGAYSTWVPRKVSGTTAKQVKLNTIMNVRLVIDRSLPGGSTAAFSLNPEIAIT